MGVFEQILAELQSLKAAVDAIAPVAAGDVWADGVLTVADAAKFSGISRSNLYVLMGNGSLVWSQPAGRRVIPRRAIVSLLKENQRNAGEASL